MFYFTDPCKNVHADEKLITQCEACEELNSIKGVHSIFSYGAYCHYKEKMAWKDAASQCQQVDAKLPFITLIRQNNEIGAFTGVSYIKHSKQY